MEQAIQRRLSSVVLLILLGLLAACGGNEPFTGSSDSAGAPSNAKSHNNADVQFATEMIPHHAQALSMVDATVGKDLSPEVAAVADRIRMSQAPEIEQMAAWLGKWGEPVPPTSRDHTGRGHDMGTIGMPGMASMEDMAALENAQGPEFDQMFLSMMIEHHGGAVDMAKAELQDGENTDVKAMAQEIVDAQQAEITTMEELLSGN